jgi:hypothetical protein
LAALRATSIIPSVAMTEAGDRPAHRAAAGPEQHPGPDRERRRPADRQEVRDQDPAQRQHRPDRQVDAARQDDEGQPDPEDRVDRRLLDDVEQVLAGQEVRRGDREQHAQPDQAEEALGPAREPQRHQQP